MKQPTQTAQIVEFLKANLKERFSAREIASAIITKYPELYKDKQDRSKAIHSERELLSQVVSEIGAKKDALASAGILWQDKPSPRRYWFNSGKDDPIKESSVQERLLEQDLYPLLGHYLREELGLYWHRIDEKRSKNSFGNDGNIWLHPDMVAVQILDGEFDTVTRECLKDAGASRVRWWSFEVKRELNRSNVRKSFFQAVSNSSWAHEGYLVTSAIATNVDSELKMLSNLHGIGVIVLNVENPSESDIVYPARMRMEIDWHSVDRIVRENVEFKEVVDSVAIYYKTGKPKVLEQRTRVKISHKAYKD
ncbi:MAG: hypothetical protein ACTTJS_07945 [Wolinella sp.]